MVTRDGTMIDGTRVSLHKGAECSSLADLALRVLGKNADPSLAAVVGGKCECTARSAGTGN